MSRLNVVIVAMCGVAVGFLAGLLVAALMRGPHVTDLEEQVADLQRRHEQTQRQRRAEIAMLDDYEGRLNQIVEKNERWLVAFQLFMAGDDIGAREMLEGDLPPGDP